MFLTTMIYIRYIFFIIFALSFHTAFSADLPISNAGFAPSNIWYSKDPFYEGDKVRIYTIIFNGSSYDLSGTVEFLDNGLIVGKTKFSLAGGGRVQDLWVDWKASKGKHTITARFADVYADGPNGRQSVNLPNTETGINERLIEIDPIVMAEQKRVEAKKIEEMQSQAVVKVNDIVQVLSEATPEPVKEGVSSGVSWLEQFRIDQARQLDLIKEQKAKEIDAITKQSLPRSSDSLKSKSKNEDNIFDSPLESVAKTTEKPFAYAMLAAVGALQFIFEWRILFYGVILYVLYRIIKWISIRIRNRE